MNEGCGKPLERAKVCGETTGTCETEIVPSATLLAVHTRLSLLPYLTTEFSVIKRKILGGLGRWHIVTTQHRALAGTQRV